MSRLTEPAMQRLFDALDTARAYGKEAADTTGSFDIPPVLLFYGALKSIENPSSLFRSFSQEQVDALLRDYEVRVRAGASPVVHGQARLNLPLVHKASRRTVAAVSIDAPGNRLEIRRNAENGEIAILVRDGDAILMRVQVVQADGYEEFPTLPASWFQEQFLPEPNSDNSGLG
jgi:hypothetical protein